MVSTHSSHLRGIHGKQNCYKGEIKEDQLFSLTVDITDVIDLQSVRNTAACSATAVH